LTLTNPFVTTLFFFFSKFSSAILERWRLINIFLNSWRTRGVVLTWWLYLLVVRLLSIQEIRSVLLLGMLMETRFCFLFIIQFLCLCSLSEIFYYVSCSVYVDFVNKSIEIKLRHIWLHCLSFIIFNFLVGEIYVFSHFVLQWILLEFHLLIFC